MQMINLSIVNTTYAFTCNECGFSIWMPGKPTLQQVKHNSFVGTVNENSYTLKTKSEKYSSSYTKLPKISFSLLSDSALFNKAKKGLLKSTGVQEISFQKISYSGKDGRELVFKIIGKNKSDPTNGKARFYLFGKTLYVMMITSNKGPEGTALIDRYLNSFKLLSTEVSIIP